VVPSILSLSALVSSINLLVLLIRVPPFSSLDAPLPLLCVLRLEVQKEHFAHLDKVGDELCTSFKEELWILQGKGRQNAEVRKEGFAFVAVVGLIDFAIISS